MSRPLKNRTIDKDLKFTCFKPVWVPKEGIEIVEINPDELQAIRLCNYDKLSQIDSAKEMWISASTFNRIFKSWCFKVADALTNWKAIRALKN